MADKGGWFPKTEPHWWSDLKGFVANPGGFVLGVVLSSILGGLFDVVELVIGAMRTVLVGNDQWFGLADLPGAVISPFLSVGSTVGLTVLRLIEDINEAITGVVGATGPFEVIIGTALWSVWILVAIAGIYALVSTISGVSTSSALSTLRGGFL